MFRTSKCSSSGSIKHIVPSMGQLIWTHERNMYMCTSLPDDEHMDFGNMSN